MKDEALSLLENLQDPAQGLNILREYLQAFVLRSLHENEAFLCLSFVGGTALRFLYNLPRFSEDLDFSLEVKDNYFPVKWMEKVKRDLTYAGFDAILSWNDRKTVHTGWIRIGEILKEAGLAALIQQKLSIKLEIDSCPPQGASYRSQIVDHHMLVTLRHHDLPSLMAGKIHAMIIRPFDKGRDWYDFLWYRAKRPVIEPNLLLLQNALDQSQGKGSFRADQWKQILAEKVNKIDLKKLKNDVSPFLERPVDLELINAEKFWSALEDI